MPTPMENYVLIIDISIILFINLHVSSHILKSRISIMGFIDHLNSQATIRIETPYFWVGILLVDIVLNFILIVYQN